MSVERAPEAPFSLESYVLIGVTLLANMRLKPADWKYTRAFCLELLTVAEAGSKADWALGEQSACLPL